MRKMNNKKIVLIGILVVLVLSMSVSVIATHNPGHFDPSKPVRNQKVPLSETTKIKTTRDNTRLNDALLYGLCQEKGCADSDAKKTSTQGYVYAVDKGLNICTKTYDGCKVIGGKHFVDEQVCIMLPGAGVDLSKSIKGTEVISCEGACKNGACLKPTCSDKLKNQGETNIDCGGPCKACPPESEEGKKEKEEEKKCLVLGCYDTDGGNVSSVFGKVLLKKKKLGGKEYCIPSEDTCKSTMENGVKTWHIIEQTCKKNEQNGFLFSDPQFNACEGLCDKGACLPSTCADGYQNQGEQGIDCGGPCSSCVTEYCEDLTGDTPTVKDFVTTKYVNGELFNVDDKCVDNNGKEVENTAIDYQIIKLHEKICVDNTVQNKEYDCGAYGNNDVCVDGKCVDLSCESTDAQDTKGFIQKGASILKADGVVVSDHPDFCSNSYVEPLTPVNEGQYLVESVCVFDQDNPYLPPTTCPLGCKDGACKSCSDPDLGANIFVQATSQGYPSVQSIFNNQAPNPDIIMGALSGTDYCFIKEQSNPVNSCQGKDCNIKEYGCGLFPDGAFLTSLSQACPQGCTNGACIDCPMVSVEDMMQLGLLNPSLENAIETNAFNEKIILGDPNAPYTLIMFNQYDEPFAKKWYKDTFPLIKHYYIDTGKINFQIREYPTLASIPNGPQIARATFCALNQGKYWEFVNLLLHENTLNYDTQLLIEYAELEGMSTSIFEACLDSPEAQAMVDKDIALGNAIFGNNAVNTIGLPTFVIPLGLSAVEIIGIQDYPIFDKIFHYYFGSCYEAKACYDSDKGIDLGWDSEFGENYEVGMTVGYQDNGAFTKQQDTCALAQEIFGSNYDFANDPELEPNDIGVIEGSCGNKQQEITVTSNNEFDDYVAEPTQADWHKCEFGCNEGRCLDQISCVDDQGQDYFVKDFVTFTNGTSLEKYTDSCLDENNIAAFEGPTLSEPFCEGNSVNSIAITCENGCKDGKCECPALGWKKMDSGTINSLQDIWGSSNGNIYAVGEKGIILYYNGVNWEKIESGTTGYLHGIWGSSSNDVYVVGEDGIIIHYNGISWEKMNSPITTTLFEIWGSSSNDIYAVGEDGIIIHYDGISWKEINIINLGKQTVYGIWGSSSNDIYAVGEDGIILHYDGVGWEKIESNLTTGLIDIWGSSSNDIFVVGGFGLILHYNGVNWEKMNSGVGDSLAAVWGSSEQDVYVSPLFQSYLLHYDGVSWQKIEINHVYNLFSIWGTSNNNNIYAVGPNGAILHTTCVDKPTSGFSVDNCRYIDQDFDQEDKPLLFSHYFLCDVHNDFDNAVNLQKLFYVISKNGIPAYGDSLVHSDVPIMLNPGDSMTFVERGSPSAPIMTSSDCESKNIVLKIDDMAQVYFNEIVPVACYDYNKCPTSPTNQWGNLIHTQSTLEHGQTGEQQTDTCTGDVLKEYICDVNQISSNQFKCPYGCNNGICLKENQCDGSQLKWEKVETGILDDLIDLFVISPNDVYAIGTDGIILHYNDKCWEKINGNNKQLRDIWGSSKNDVYIVGEDGLILHYDGISWNQIESGTTEFLFNIVGFSSNDIYIFGSNSTFLHYDGISWNKLDIPNYLLLDVWGTSGNNLYAVGWTGVILHYNGNSWEEMGSGTGASLFSVWGFSNNDIYAVGAGETILHYDGNSWNEISTGKPGLYYSYVWGSSSNDVYAVLSEEKVLHYDGISWNNVVTGTSEALHGVMGSSNKDVYMVGNNGTILHYSCSSPQQLCSPIEPTNNMCEESEYGVDYFVKDFVTFKKPDGSYEVHEDSCYTEYNGKPAETGVELFEAGCLLDQFMNCPCTNGACGCLDTENSIYEASTAKGYEVFDETTKNNPQSFIEAPDFCTAYASLEEIKNNPVQDGNYVTEAICKDTILVGYKEPELCPEGYHCQGGACVSDQECVQLKNYEKGSPESSEYSQVIASPNDKQYGMPYSPLRLAYGNPENLFEKPAAYLAFLPGANLYSYNLTFKTPINPSDTGNENNFFLQNSFINFQGYKGEIMKKSYTPYPSYFDLELLFSKATKSFAIPGEKFTFSLNANDCHTLTFHDVKSGNNGWCSLSLDGEDFIMNSDDIVTIQGVTIYANATYETTTNGVSEVCKVGIDPKLVEFYLPINCNNNVCPSTDEHTVYLNKKKLEGIIPHLNILGSPKIRAFGYNLSTSYPIYLAEHDQITDPVLNAFTITFLDLLDGIPVNGPTEEFNREEISFVGGSTSAEINFVNNDGKEVMIPLSADSEAFEKGAGSFADPSLIATKGPFITKANDEPVFYGTDAPWQGDQNIDERLYLEEEVCSGKIINSNVLACQNAYFLIIDNQNRAHLMQIAEIDLSANTLNIHDVTYGKEYNLLAFTLISENNFTLEDIGTISLFLNNDVIYFKHLGFGGYDDNIIAHNPIITKEKGRLYIINLFKQSQYYEGIVFEEFNDGSFDGTNGMYSFQYLNKYNATTYNQFSQGDLVIGAYSNDNTGYTWSTIEFNTSALQGIDIFNENKDNTYGQFYDGFGWFDVSKTNKDFQEFMTFKGTRIIFDVSQKKSLLIDHPLEAVSAFFSFGSKPDSKSIFLETKNKQSNSIYYNQTLSQAQKQPLTSIELPNLLGDGELVKKN